MKRIRLLLPLALLLAATACAGGGSAYERGRAAFERGDMRAARVELLNAIEADPYDAAARVLQARVLLALGDGAAAETEVLLARQVGAPAEATAHLLAEARLLQDDPNGALAESEGAAPEHQAQAARIRARAFLALGNDRAAGAELDRALRLAPDDGDIWTEIARFRRRGGDLAGAIAAADRAVAAAPSDPAALTLRGELTRSQYGLAAALPWFDRALEIDPRYVDALLERAATYGDLGRMTEMLADARAAHRLTGGHAKAYYLQALLAARAGDHGLARSLYGRTGGAFDAVPAGMLLEGAIAFGSGNYEQASGRLAQLVARQPGNRRARRLLAAAQWRMGDAGAVADTLRPVADRPDADGYSLVLAGRALSRLGERERAASYLARSARPGPPAAAAVRPDETELAALREAAAARPGDGPTEVRLVTALLARGETGEAVARARRVQAANPGAPQAHILAGDALAMAGDFTAATEAYRRAANIAFTESVALRLIAALRRSGEAEAADHVLDLFARQNPRNVSARILLAGRAMQAGEWESAIMLYEALRARLGDNDATLLNNLAWAYAAAGDSAAALPLARRAWGLDRNNPATADTLGWLLFAIGEDKPGGLTLVARALRGAPSEAVIRRRLERGTPPPSQVGT